MKKAYITGATGAIGMALIEKLLAEKVDVTVFVRADSSRICRVKGLPVKVVEAGLEDLNSVDICSKVCTKYSSKITGEVSDEASHKISEKPSEAVFYHLGWTGTIGPDRNDMEIQQKNTEYTLDAIRLAARLDCSCFVGAGSQAEYGPTDGILRPDTSTQPVMAYGKAKLAACMQGAELAQEYGMNFRWVRILSVYGPYDGELTMVTSVCRKLLLGQQVELTQGLQKWDYLYSKDAARALYLIGKTAQLSRSEASGDNAGTLTGNSIIYCLGSGVARPLKEYIDEMCDACGADRSLLLYGKVPYGTNQVMYLQADIADLKQDTGFEPMISFSEGIKETINWMKMYYDMNVVLK